MNQNWTKKPEQTWKSTDRPLPPVKSSNIPSPPSTAACCIGPHTTTNRTGCNTETTSRKYLLKLNFKLSTFMKNIKTPRISDRIQYNTSPMTFSVSVLSERARSRGCSRSKSTNEEIWCFKHKKIVYSNFKRGNKVTYLQSTCDQQKSRELNLTFFLHINEVMATLIITKVV